MMRSLDLEPNAALELESEFDPEIVVELDPAESGMEVDVVLLEVADDQAELAVELRHFCYRPRVIGT
jgi:hypothetical protein